MHGHCFKRHQWSGRAQAKPGLEHYEQLCREQEFRGNCDGPFNKTCSWTCGDCDALPQFPQYETFCAEHLNSTMCAEVNQTCTWKKNNSASGRVAK